MPASYDRFTHLLDFWFDLFSEPTVTDEGDSIEINYKNMVCDLRITFLVIR